MVIINVLLLIVQDLSVQELLIYSYLVCTYIASYMTTCMYAYNCVFNSVIVTDHEPN